jgi:hypothetical protein
MPSPDLRSDPISAGRKYVIAEALLDFYEAEDTPDFRSAIERAQSRYPRFVALVRFDFEVEVAHSIESGSVRSRVTVLAFLMALIHAIEHYGDFRDGIDRIFEDAKHFGVQANQYILFDAHPHTASPFVFQTKTGLVGVLKRFRDDVQFLNEHADDITPNEMKKRLTQLAKEADHMLTNASDEADFQLLRDFLWETSRQVIRPSQYPFQHAPPLSADPFRYPMISPNRQELYRFLDSLRQRSRKS